MVMFRKRGSQKRSNPDGSDMQETHNAMLKHFTEQVEILAADPERQRVFIKEESDGLDTMAGEMVMLFQDWAFYVEELELLGERGAAALVHLNAVIGQLDDDPATWEGSNLGSPEWEAVRSAAKDVLDAMTQDRTLPAGSPERNAVTPDAGAQNPVVTGSRGSYEMWFTVDQYGALSVFLDRISEGQVEDCPDMADVASSEELARVLQRYGVPDDEAGAIAAREWPLALRWANRVRAGESGREAARSARESAPKEHGDDWGSE